MYMGLQNLLEGAASCGDASGALGCVFAVVQQQPKNHDVAL